ncbi:DUF3109 family protein [Glaciecola sp. 1036]|uniref:DUF3109 family protein n=1 Tax=Alteromonadaceae TaxID=72275 RepID=UPI003D018457
MFQGRTSELKRIYRAFGELENGPQLILLKGQPGVGKTSLVQRFYQYLIEHHDPDNYWPDNLHDIGKASSVAPLINSVEYTNVQQMPWLWLGFRCTSYDSAKEHAVKPVAFEILRRQLRHHLFYLISSAKNKKANLNLAKSAFSVLASFAVPGSGQIIESVNSFLETSSDALTAEGFFASLKERFSSQKSDNISVDELLNRDTKRIEDEASNAFNALLKVHNMPLVLVVDDVQFIDQASLDILKQLLKTAHKQKWPLMIIMTVWDDAIEKSKSLDFSKPIYDYFAELKSDDDLSNYVREIRVKPIPTEFQIDLVTQSLQHLDLAAIDILIEKSGGNLDMLKDYVDELKNAPGWLNEQGQLEVSVQELTSLPSKALDMARNRLRTAGAAMRELLVMGSGQGREFDEISLLETLALMDKNTQVSEQLCEAESAYGFVASRLENNNYKELEFKRAEYFEASYEFFRTHPKATVYLKTIAKALHCLVSDKRWNDLSEQTQQRLIQRLCDLSEEFELGSENWNLPMANTLRSLALMRISVGDYFNADKNCQLLLKLAYLPQSLIQEAWQIRVTSAYMSGDVEKERQLLNDWPTVASKHKVSQHTYLSRFLMRTGKCEQGLDVINKAEQLSTTNLQWFNVSLCKAVILWASGLSAQALALLIKMEASIKSSSLPQWLVSHFYHTASLVLHDLEKNEQVIFYAQQSVQLQREKGDVQQLIICKVNLADAYWGVGMLDKADIILSEAYDQAMQSKLDHAIDIAAICLANIRLEQGKVKDSKKLYSQGVALAEKIGHQWDYIYGKTYQCLATYQEDPLKAYEVLTQMAQEAEEGGYFYLCDLARAFQYVVAFYGKIFHEIQINEADRELSPLYKSYAYAYSLLTNKICKQTTHDFISALAQCEGIKGSRNFILQALNKLTDIELTSVQNEFVKRWQARFSPQNSEQNYKACNYRHCEARCCYDGVYVTDAEVKSITAYVEKFPQYFEHLPQEFIVKGDWEGFSGDKTAVREHQYKSPDFPSHFNQTRCVFALTDGACSLHKLALDEDLMVSDVKPKSCSLFPIRKKGNKAKKPLSLGERDETALGIQYPGFASYVPCSQNRKDGRHWQLTLQDEIIFLAKLNSGKKSED